MTYYVSFSQIFIIRIHLTRVEVIKTQHWIPPNAHYGIEVDPLDHRDRLFDRYVVFTLLENGHSLIMTIQM